jgi:hypothetical protein
MNRAQVGTAADGCGPRARLMTLGTRGLLVRQLELQT